MTQPIVQLRLVLDVRYLANGTSLDELKKKLIFVAEHAYGEGLLTSETEAEVEEHSFAVMETPEAVAEGEVADLMLERIENGLLRVEDIPAMLARYGLMETPQFVAEMRERLDNQADAADEDEEELQAVRSFQNFLGEQDALINQLRTEYNLAVVTGTNLDTYFMEAADDLKDLLGAAAANDCSDDEAEQDTAISAAEQWVTENVNHSTAVCIAAVLYLRGIEAGTAELRYRFK